MSEVFEIWNSGPLEYEFFNKLSEIDQVKHILTCAHLAPSSHNTQPWRFTWNVLNKTIELALDKKWILPESDVHSRQALISAGCAWYNIQIASKYFGYYIHSIYNELGKFTTNSEVIIPLLKFEITYKGNPNNLLKAQYQSIFTRRVDRGEYDANQKVDKEWLSEIKASTNHSQLQLDIISDKARLFMLAELQGMADTFVINSKKFSKELIQDWIIENHSSKGRGMPGNTFKLSDAQVKYLKERIDQDKQPEAAEISGMLTQGKRGILSSCFIGVISSKDNNPESWFVCGQMLQQLLIEIEKKGMVSSIHAGLAEVEQVNKLVLRPMMMMGRRPLILFRAGYLKDFENRSPHSPRVKLDEVIEII